MDWKQLADKANRVVEERGGMKSVEEDAGELAEIVKGSGTLSEKAKQAMQAIKEPGAHHDKPAPPTD